MSGWVKLHRKILDNPVLDDDLRFNVFVKRLLLRASHKRHKVERRGVEITLEPGQVLISIRALASDCGVGHQVMRRVLDLFEKRHMVDIKTNTLGSLVTICNWKFYQDFSNPDNTAPTQQTTQHQHSTNTPYKKEKNEKKEDSPQLPSVIAPQGADQKKARKRSWPKDFTLSDRMRTNAETKHPGIDAKAEFERFANHHQSKGSMFVDWQRAWVTWYSSPFDKIMKSEGADHDGKRRGFMPSNRELAEQVARNMQFGKADGQPAGADVSGEGHKPNGQTRPGDSNHSDGGGVPEIPTWFDQDGHRPNEG